MDSQQGEPTALRRIGGPQAHKGGRDRCEGEAVARQGGTQFPRGLFPPASAGAFFGSLPGAVGAIAPFTPLWGALIKAVPVGDVTMLLAWWRAWQGAGSP